MKKTYQVILAAIPVDGGTVSGGGTYDDGSSVTITAVPKNVTGSRYQFTSWKEDGLEISKDPVYSFTIARNRNFIANFLNVTSVERSGELPAQFMLSQNYPNPFNPSTTIGYDLPNSVYVSLKIFNIFGQLAAALVEEKKEAGHYHVQWNASNVSSGIYFYRLHAGEFIETKKLVLWR